MSQAGLYVICGIVLHLFDLLSIFYIYIIKGTSLKEMVYVFCFHPTLLKENRTFS